MPKGKTNGNGHSNGNSEAIADRVQRYRRALEQNETRGDSALRSPDTPPNFGRLPIPQIFTFGSRLSTLAQVYRNPDEAVKDSLENARFMRNDPAIMECLEARQRSVALLNWHLEPEDKDDQTQKALVNELTLILKRIPNFTEYRRNLLEAIWYGRSAIQHAYGFERIKKQRRTILNKWRPINGDKLAFRWDDGSGKFSDDDVGIKVGVTWSLEDKLAGNRTIEFTDFGPAYFLEPWERTRIALHRHIIEDGAYEDPISAGRIHGVGVRDRIYWTWYQKQETMATLMELIERTGTGFTIYYYPDGNMQAKTQVESLAEKQKHDNILVMPRMPGDPAADAYGIERIEPSTAGISAMKEIIHEFFGHQMKRYILGQILSSESAATGLGSGVADLHQDTFMLIVQYDAVKLEETLTRDLVKVLQSFNFPEFRDVNIAFKIDTGSNESEKKMSGYKQAWDMGAKIRAVDVMDAIGASMPSEDEETLVNPTIMQQLRLWRQQQKAGQQAGDEPGSPEDMFGPLADMIGGQQGAEGGEMGGEMPPEGPGGMPPDGGEGGPEVGPEDQGPTQYAKRKPEQGELYEIQRRLNRALDGIHDETGTFCLGKVSDFWPLATNAAGVNGVDHWSVFYHGSEASAVVITSGHIRLGSRVWNFRNRQNDLAEVFTRAVMRLGQVAVERQLYAKKFEPDKHPRDENGKFSHSDAVASDIVKTIGQESLESIEAVVDEDQLSELIGDREPTVQDAFNALQSREDYVANYGQASKRVMRSVLRKMDSVLGADDETAEPEDDIQELMRTWAGRAIAEYFGKRGVAVPAAMVRYAKKRVKPAPGQMDLFGGGTVPHQASIDWKEELHPRGEGGKFALKGEGVGKLTGQTPAAKQADEAFALERPQESRQKWLDIDKPLAPLKKPVDLFGQPIKPAAKPTTAGAGKQTQPGLFSTKGAPGQMNLFEDKGVPEDMVQKPAEVKKPTAEDIAREAIEKGENISVTMKRRGLDHLGPMRREVADAVDRLKAEGVGKVEKPASEARKAAQEKALAKRAEEAKAGEGKPAAVASTSKPHHEVLHSHIMAGHVDEAVKHLEGLSKADARKAATDAGLPFHNAKTRKEILEGVRKIAENNTPEKRAARQKKEAIDNAHSDAREVLDNAEAHKNELLGAPITGDLTDEQVKNPHDPKHKPAVAAAWRAEVAKQIAKLHPDDPNADKLRARAEALETEQEQKQSAVNAATSEANQQPAAPAKADPRAAPPDPAAAAVPRVTNESFATGDWDMAHAGLGSELVISKMAVGMKGIEGREYGIREHSPGKWQLVSRPMASIESLTGGKADKAPDSAFPAEALAKGQKVEAEHTSDPAQAKEIAKDHLTEDTGYYDKLAEMEAKPKTPAKGTGAEQGPAKSAAAPSEAKEPWEMSREEFTGKSAIDPKQDSREQTAAKALFDAAKAKGFTEGGGETPRLTKQEAERAIKTTGLTLEHFKTGLAGHARLRDASGQYAGQLALTRQPSRAEQGHREEIVSALAAGKPVPPEVLKDYPDLQAAAPLTSDQVESLPGEPGTQFEDTLDEAKKAGAVPSAKQVQSKSHKVADVISGKHSVGVPGSRSDEAKARAAGLYVNTVRGTTIFAKNAESAKPLEDYLKSGGKYGSDRFSELLGYSPQEIDEYRKFLSSTGQGHLIETAGEAVAAPEHSPAVQMAIVRAHHTLHDAGLAEKPAHPKVVASPSEIPYSAAYAAHQGTSFVPETRAKQRQEEYASTLNSHYEDLSAMVQTPEQQQLLDEEFFRFKEGFKKRYLAKLAADSRVMSSMITGPARFPTARNEKRNNTAHKRLTELLDYEKKAVQAIRGKINPTESGMIKSSDPNAVESLQAKLSAHENGQKRMRAVNDAHKRFLKDSASLDKSDLTDKEKEMVRNYKPAYSWEPHPYPPYRLSNNNAEIRRLKARIADVSSMKASAGKEESWGDVKLVENADAGRIQLVFPGKPDEATRTALKRQGFRWSPTEGAWQRHLNNAGRYAAESVLKSIGKTKEDVPGK